MKRLLILAVLLSGCGGGGVGSGAVLDATGRPAPSASAVGVKPDPTEQPDVVFDLPVEVTKRTASVARNATASVRVKTTAGAECGIDVRYRSGSSTAEGLEPKTANAKGAITWKWLVARSISKGSAPIVITCTLGDQSGRADTSVKVK
jgi:hypothetical protein